MKASEVHRDGQWVYKKQSKFMTDNEIWILRQLHPTGYVPFAEQIDPETIRLEYIEETPVTDIKAVTNHFKRILGVLSAYGIRHGDLTGANILIKDNHPYVIDFSESRLTDDPRPDKRREGDEYHLFKYLRKLENATKNG